MQLENNPTGGLKEFLKSPIKFLIDAILHLVDFFNYKITKRNIGRWGASHYTEAKPLQISCANLNQEQATARAEVWKDIVLNKRGQINENDAIKMKEAGIKISKNDPDYAV